MASIIQTLLWAMCLRTVHHLTVRPLRGVCRLLTCHNTHLAVGMCLVTCSRDQYLPDLFNHIALLSHPTLHNSALLRLPNTGLPRLFSMLSLSSTSLHRIGLPRLPRLPTRGLFCRKICPTEFLLPNSGMSHTQLQHTPMFTGLYHQS